MFQMPISKNAPNCEYLVSGAAAAGLWTLGFESNSFCQSKSKTRNPKSEYYPCPPCKSAGKSEIFVTSSPLSARQSKWREGARSSIKNAILALGGPHLAEQGETFFVHPY